MAIFSSSPYSGGGAPSSGPRDSSKEVPVVPPPPPTSVEVSVRTMESDLEHMGRSLEEALQSTNSLGQAQTQGAPPLPSILGGERPSKPVNWGKLFLWGTVGAVGIIVFFFMGYFFLPLVFEETAEEAAPPVAAPPPIGLPAAKPTSTSPAPVFLGHQSFLRNPADETLDLKFGNPANPAYYNLYLDDLKGVLSRTGSGSEFVEVALTRSDGQAFAWTQILGLLGISAVEEDFWTSRFEQDFTAFAYVQNGAWHPGYILKLKSSQSPLILQPTVLKMETDPNLANFFLSPPGLPAQAGDAQGSFRDSQISGQPVRARSFSKFDSALVYGWLYNQYLVVSTSEAGFREAMLRL